MEAPVHRRVPRFTDEDIRPTSPKELWGWYAYGLAAEVFAVCGIGSFIPMVIEQLGRERGVLKSDGVTPCIAATTAARGIHARDNAQCVIPIFGMQINTSSYALYTFSISVLVQAVVLVSISAIADHGGNRKNMLLILGFTGSIACMMFLLVFPGILLVGSLLTIVTVTCLGNSNVLLNSFLPILVANHPSIQDSVLESAIDMAPLRSSLNPVDSTNSGELGRRSVNLHRLSSKDASRLSHDDDDSDSDSVDLDRHTVRHSINLRQLSTKDFDNLGQESAALKLSNQISSKSVGIGYASAVTVQIFSILILVVFSKFSPSLAKTSTPMRVVLFVVGVWWAAFTIPAARWLRQRPGPPLPVGSVSSGRWSWFSYIAFAWASLWQTTKVAIQLRQVVVFLIAWFLLSDATATVSGTAILLARAELQMGTASVAAISVTAMVSGIVGAFAWPKIGRRFKLQSNHIIMTCIALYEFVPLYGLMGFVPFFKNWGVGGLQQAWEIFPVAFLHGFVMGGLSSHCRAFFGILIPPGSEAAFYALMAVTDKGSSVIGPAIAGRIVDRTGSVRAAFFFLAPLILLPIPIMWYVDVEKGRADAIEMAGRLQKWKAIALEDISRSNQHIDESQEQLMGGRD